MLSCMGQDQLNVPHVSGTFRELCLIGMWKIEPGLKRKTRVNKTDFKAINAVDLLRKWER